MDRLIKAISAVLACAMLLSAAGCVRDESSEMPSETDNYSEIFVETTSADSNSELSVPDSVKGAKFTYSRAQRSQYEEQIDRMIQETGNDYPIGLIGHLYENDECSDIECAEILGRLWTIFGKPDDPSTYDESYNYTVAATDSDGKTYYVEVFQYGDSPLVGGPICEGYEKCSEIAQDIAELIKTAEIADYEWTTEYSESSLDILYGAKDGKAFSKSYVYGVSEDEIDEKFSSMSEEEFNKWYAEIQEAYISKKNSD